jgi:hypothetical protein
MINAEIAERPEVRALATESDQLLARATNYPRIATAPEYEAAGEELKQIKAAQSRVDAVRKAITRPIDEAKAAAMAFFRPFVTKLEAAEIGIKRSMVVYAEQLAAQRREDQRRADEAARRTQERLRERALVAETSGKVEKAAALGAQADAVVAPVIQRQPPKVAGVQTREVWKFVVEDEAKLPREYLVPDESKIRRVVQALKGDARIAGVRVWSEPAIAAGPVSQR